MSRHSTNPWVVLVIICLAQFMVVLDATIVNVALPSIQKDLGLSEANLQWIINAYTLVFAGFLLLGGRAGDLLGRKRLFLFSMALFIGGSVMAGTSQSFGQMLVYRVMQGTGGGTLIPVSQAILRETFPPAEQGMAMAIFSMGVILAPALGPTARNRIELAWRTGQVAVSAISFWEVAMLAERGHITLPMPISRWRAGWLKAGLTEIPLNGHIALQSFQLENLHRDPADRFIIATAMENRFPPFTADQKIPGWGNELARLSAAI